MGLNSCSQAVSDAVRVALAACLSLTIGLACHDVWAQSLSQIFKQVAPSVVVVLAIDSKQDVLGFGSGVVVSPDGFVATNEHVVREAARVVVRLQSGERLDAAIVAADEQRDLALLLVVSPRLVAARLGDSDSVEVGDRVVAIGAPQGLSYTLSEGIISGLRLDTKDRLGYLQTTVPISPGSSGGPIISMDGRVMGLAVGSLEGQNLNFAIPINDVRAALPKARATLRALRERLAREQREQEEARRREEEARLWAAEKERRDRIEAARREQRQREEARQQAEERERQVQAEAARRKAEQEAERRHAEAERTRRAMEVWRRKETDDVAAMQAAPVPVPAGPLVADFPRPRLPEHITAAMGATLSGESVVLWNRGVAALAASDYGAAIRPLELLLGRVSDRSAQSIARRGLGFGYFGLGQYDRAEQQFRLAALASPEEPWSWLAAGIAALAQKRLPEAEEALARVRDAGGDIAAEGAYAAVLVAVERGDPSGFVQRARTTFVDDFPRHSAAPTVLYKLFIIAAERGDMAEARSWGERFRIRYPTHQFRAYVELRLATMTAAVASEVPQVAATSTAITAPVSSRDPMRTVVDGDFPFTYYLRLIQSKVGERWAPPRAAATDGERVIVLFEIQRDGQVRQPTVERSSGNALYDQTALRAVTEASPFPPLPPEYKRPTLQVHLGFSSQ